MRKLLYIFILLASIGSFGQQQGTWTTVTYSGSLQARVYLPPNYASRIDWPAFIFEHGQGPRDNGFATMLNEGLPMYIQQGRDYNHVIFCPYINSGTWSPSQTLTAYNYLLANYQVDPNEIHITGLSLGATGGFQAIEAYPGSYASAVLSQGVPVSVNSAAIQAYRQVPIYDFHGTADNTQNMSLFNVICDSLWNRAANDPAQLQVLPRNLFVWNVGHSSTIWNDSVYNQWDKWSSWAFLHHKNKDTTAIRYVDSLHISPSWDFYWQAKRAVDALSSGSLKTSLLSDLATEYAIINGASSKRYVLDFGISGKTTSGNVNNMTNGATNAFYSNLIDDAGGISSIGFTVVSRVNSGTVTVDKGVPGTYFGLAQNTLDDSWEVYNTGGTVKFTGLNNSKQYHIRIIGISDQTVSTSIEFGIKATIAGTQKVIRSGFRSFTRYMEWKNVSPTSGEISIALSSYVTNGWGSLNAIELVEVGTGNESPTASAGADQYLTQPTNSTTLTGVGSDVDGTISSYAWTKLSGPSCTIVSPSSATTSVTGMNSAGTYVFQLTVTDNGGATGIDQMTVVINAVTPVIANAGQDQTIPVGKSLAVLDGSNSTGSGLTYSWRLITTVYGNTNGAKGKINHPTAVRTGIMLLGYWPGGYNYELTVSDGSSTDKDTVNIYVQWNEIPAQAALNGGIRLATTQDSIDVAAYNPGACRVGVHWMVTAANGYGVSGGDSVGNDYLSIYGTGSSITSLPAGAKIWIKGGYYKRIEFVNNIEFQGTYDQPNIITTYGPTGLQTEEFVFSNTGNWGHVEIQGGYKAGQYGVPGYDGHNSGYAFSRGRYGIRVLNNFSSLGTGGLNIQVSGNISKLTIDGVEMGDGNFGSLNIKKNGTENSYDTVVIKNCLVHNSEAEGGYIGETSATDVATKIKVLIFENNRVLWSGNESIQIGKLYGGTYMANNVIVRGGGMAYSPFGPNQDGIFQLGYVAGSHTVRSNIFQGAAIGGLNQGNRIDAGENLHSATDSVKYLNNLWLQMGGDYTGFLAGTQAPNLNMTTFFDSCRFGQLYFNGDKFYVNSQATNRITLFGAANNAKYTMRHTFRDNTKTKQIEASGASPVIDTTAATVVAMPSPQYVNSGFPQDFRYDLMLNWVDTIYRTYGWEPTTGLAGVVRVGEVKVYDSLEYCTFMGKFYRSKHGSNAGNMPVGATDSHWEKLTWTDGINTYDYPPEDFRLISGDPYRSLGMGLLDVPSNPVVPSGGIKIRKRIKIQ